MSERQRVVEAAGGVVWRGSHDDVEIALVHRPAYDDWSIPKGKLHRGEHPLVGAVREVTEETGYEVRLGPPLGETAYELPNGRGKRVRYWSMRASGDGGTLPADGEVDELRWLPPGDALTYLQPRREQPVLRAFVEAGRAGTLVTRPLVLVRHASAGERSSWRGDDSDRPLDELGRAQAGALAAVLRGYGATRVVSADVVRCTQTVAPFAAASGLTVETEPLFSEAGSAADPDAAVERLLGLARGRDAVVVCTQRKALPPLLRALSEVFGADVTRVVLDKGAFCVLHLGGEPVRALAAERFDV
ncbi:MAG: NUDIX hydrolase [Streptosporangiales bacterium]|nr:NUDIX hydrolase [Streptosporangiales bacterium]MBO0889457.1 NUDIX hydrolase [Acidothermales bacterium]